MPEELLQPAPAASASASGFTLVETLMALTVILFGFMGVLVMHTGALRSGVAAEEQTMAVFLAETKIEEFRNMPPAGFPDNVMVYDYLDRSGRPVAEPQAFYRRGIILKRQVPAKKTSELTVSVKWAKAQPLVYTTVIPGG